MDTALDKLKKFVSIESVSTDRQRKSELMAAATFIKEELVDVGFDVDFYDNEGCPPLVIGKKIISDKQPTIGVYAHYDVQPEDPIEKWKSPPFELTEKQGKLYGRGVADDKMHVIQTIAAAKNAIAENTLKNNLVFLFEGEEEAESAHFEQLVKKDPILKNIDLFYILDSGMKSKTTPQIFYGLRGIVAFELTVRIGETDLHSGIYGNRVLNPAQVIAEIMTKIKNQKTGEILIPGFYDEVKKFSNEELDVLKKSMSNIENDKNDAKVIGFVSDFLDSKIKPGFDINGIVSGYTGQGFKTIIPSEATVKFSIRLVEYQNKERISEMVNKFIKECMPFNVEYELKSYGGGAPFFTEFNNPETKKTASILASVFGKDTLFNRSGGSIPAAEILQRLFNKPTIITGFTLPDENLHAPNENVDVEMFKKGIVALQWIFSVAP
jgi:acetylornithine deacetylase/succinyl-diaminopimelate desuccinylase-like protein